MALERAVLAALCRHSKLSKLKCFRLSADGRAVARWLTLSPGEEIIDFEGAKDLRGLQDIPELPFIGCRIFRPLMPNFRYWDFILEDKTQKQVVFVQVSRLDPIRHSAAQDTQDEEDATTAVHSRADKVRKSVETGNMKSCLNQIFGKPVCQNLGFNPDGSLSVTLSNDWTVVMIFATSKTRQDILKTARIWKHPDVVILARDNLISLGVALTPSPGSPEN